MYMPEYYAERDLEEKAWDLYCEETKGDMHVADFWEQLPDLVKKLYIDKVKKT